MGGKNAGYEYSERVDPTDRGIELLAYLSGRYPHSSSRQWEERIRSGEVLVDGSPVSPDSTLSPGQEIRWRRPGWLEPETPSTFAVLFLDDHVLAVAKPAGLPTLPGAGYLENTLLHRVEGSFPGAAPVHRLGRWTSGVVLFGRTPEARAALTRGWNDPAVVKRYLALASGIPKEWEFRVSAPIGPVPHPILGTIHAVSSSGKAASSLVTVLERRQHAFLCSVEIATGRPHQIRIHLAAAGHPLVGDPLYGPGGAPAEGSRALPGDPGYRLHASELVFPHPVTGRELEVRCGAPPDLRALSPVPQG